MGGFAGAWMNAYRNFVKSINISPEGKTFCSHCNGTQIINKKPCPYCRDKKEEASGTDNKRTS